MSDHQRPRPPIQQPMGQSWATPYPRHPYPSGPWPAHTPPQPKPETSLRAPLVWTALFSMLGVILVAGVMAVVIVMFLAFIYLMFVLAGGAQHWDFSGFLGEILGNAVGPTLLVVLAVSAIVFLACGGVLVLLRLIRDIRRWAPPLQALTACGITYVGGVALLWVVAQFASAFHS